ncbi:hypothetical protein, partial [Brevibacterium ammoniilyticum]|uniref:hypothetical protein n=2 Tax=Brevibacterium ammoniilyticum TaxID=1046555 RepID=UPI003138FA45
ATSRITSRGVCSSPVASDRFYTLNYDEPGIRFARNRVHHQWADALQLNTGGFQFPIVFPMVTHEWSWVSADVIPLSKKDDQNRGIDEYRSELQGRLARRSLAVLEQVYRKMASEYLK